MPPKPRPPRAARARPPLGNRLHVSEGFRTFAVDQLEQIRKVTPRSMFGGIGLYHQDLFFGLLAGDTLYLKADDRTRSLFERAGGRPFQPFPDRGGTMKYYSVPLAVLEDLDELALWVTKALDAASRASTSPAPTRARGR